MKRNILISVLLTLVITGVESNWSYADLQNNSFFIASIGVNGNQSRSHIIQSSISGDGRFVTFMSYDSDIVPGYGGQGIFNIYIRDVQNNQTDIVTIDNDGKELGHPVGYRYSLSADGRHIAFLGHGLMLRDRIARTTETIAFNSNGSIATAFNPVISGDGRYVAFDGFGLDENFSGAIYLYDRVTKKRQIINKSYRGGPPNFLDGLFYRKGLSFDGRYMVYMSFASDLVTNDTNNAIDIFVYDRVTNQTKRVSVTSSGEQANNTSQDPSISSDGRKIVFTSVATNLPDAVRTQWTIYVHDLIVGTTVSVVHTKPTCQSQFTTHMSSSGSDSGVRLAGNGHFLILPYGFCFRNIFARINLDSGQVDTVQQGGTADQAGTPGFEQQSISNDGQSVAFTSSNPTLVSGGLNGVAQALVWRNVLEVPPTPNPTPPNKCNDSNANMAIAQRFAPEIYLHEDEPYQPQDVNSVLNVASLGEVSQFVDRVGIEIFHPLVEPPIVASVLSKYTGFGKDIRLDFPGENTSSSLAAYETRIKGIAKPLIYARVYCVSQPNKEFPQVQKVIQYWLFYFYSELRPINPISLGAHEGDWEMVQVLIGEGDSPIYTAYSQHYWGESRTWTDTLRSGDHPRVYPSLSGHSSRYLSANFGGGLYNWFDNTYPVRSGVVLPVSMLDDAEEWVNFDGRWGRDSKSVKGPKFRVSSYLQNMSMWDDPVAWFVATVKYRSIFVNTCCKVSVETSNRLVINIKTALAGAYQTQLATLAGITETVSIINSNRRVTAYYSSENYLNLMISIKSVEILKDAEDMQLILSYPKSDFSTNTRWTFVLPSSWSTNSFAEITLHEDTTPILRIDLDANGVIDQMISPVTTDTMPIVNPYNLVFLSLIRN